MKKILVLMLALVLALSVCAFAACGEKEVTYTGAVSYVSWGNTYGAKVDVTVKGEEITAVKLYTDEETGWHRTTASWTATDGQLGFEAAEAAYPEYLNKFVGKTVAEVLAVDIDQNNVNNAIETIPVCKCADITEPSQKIFC